VCQIGLFFRLVHTLQIKTQRNKNNLLRKEIIMIPTVFTTRRPGYKGFSNALNNPVASNAFGYNKLPDVNIADYKDRLEMQIYVPGIDKSDINIQLEDDVLTISYEKQETKNDEGPAYLKQEFVQDSFKRAFNLSDEIEQDKVQAHQENGILYITLPKKEEAMDKGPRAIDVK